MPGQSDDDLTIGPTAAVRPLTPPSPRFVPGTIIAGRYRLVALLGRGGMGEVYRADDLTLDQAVALKFLPEGAAVDASRLAQFHNELRVARQVSHKNVCRLYDLGEADGRRFLTMEYVDGEDLTSLLRRIGRLPPDKAVEIARQLCAGLAAAHERGVLHRDLKPANVMLDADGHVRITDFGLAAAEGDATAIHAGTPQYMAPEQLTGQPASVKSDLYALGLILFEIFTGRRAYDAKTLHELRELHQSRAITTPSSVVRNLDPAIERVILRCLERDPRERPGSALAVAAALPGGDPLAAALAAGETPSPELVAASGATGALNPVLGLSLVALVLTGAIAMAMVADRQLLVARVPLDKSIDALEDRARDVIEKLGYTGRPADTAHGIGVNGQYLTYVTRIDQSQSRWDSLPTSSIPIVRFWYRTSPRDLVPLGPDSNPTPDDPPLVISNMVLVVLDSRGQLAEFHAVAPQIDPASAPAVAPNWSVLFDAAGLTMREFRPANPQWTPRVYADQRAAWEGRLPGLRQIQVRVEAAAYQGRPVSFLMVEPWTTPSRMTQEPRSARARVLAVIATVLGLVLLAGTVGLARYNLRIDRGDRRGAGRLVLFVVVLSMFTWALSARHRATLQMESDQFFTSLAFVLLDAGILWLLYIALEPYVRRYWPDMLVSWTRVLAGRVRDPRVGRDVLIGVTVGVFVALLSQCYRLLPPLLGSPPPIPKGVNMQFLLGVRPAAAALLARLPSSLQNGMVIACLFVVARAVSGRVWIAATVALALYSMFVLGELTGDSLLLSGVFAALFSGALLATLVHFGLLAQATAFFVIQALNSAPLTMDMSKLYAPTSVWVMVLVVGLALLGFYASRAGQPLFGRLLPSD